MPTLGEELKRRREERDITLTDISEATRIGTRFLKAIESDNFSVLPGGIFTRSFIRAYAKEVGMNEDEAIALYHQQVTGASAEPLQQEAPELEERAEPREKPDLPRERRAPAAVFYQAPSRANWSTIIIAAGIIIFIALIVWALVKQLNRAETQSAPAVSSAPSAPTTGPTAPQTSPSVQPPPTGTPSQAASVAAGEAISVKLEASSGDSWIGYQVDDAKPDSTLLKQGQSLDVPPAQNQVKLNIGNRKALDLKINNRDASFPPDTPNFKAQVIISRENIQSFLP